MESIMKFFREHSKVMLIGLAGVILGVILNSLLRDRENKKFLGLLVKEHDQLLEKIKNGTLSADERGLVDKLTTEIYIMKFKCLA